MKKQETSRPDSVSASSPHLDEHIEGLSLRRQTFSRRVVRVTDFFIHMFSKHWLLLANSLLGVFIGGAFLGPVLAYFGENQAASWLIHTYHGVCDQVPSHSYYVFGHQVCLCERCLAIYSTLLLAGIALALLPRLRAKVRPLDWRLWLLLIVPMAIDGLTQLVGWRESDLLLRTLTGFLFGLGGAWFIYPRIEEVAQDLAVQPTAGR